MTNNEIKMSLLLSSYATCLVVGVYGTAAADPLHHGAGRHPLAQPRYDLYA